MIFAMRSLPLKMNSSLATIPQLAPIIRKTAARVALVGLTEKHLAVLSESFRQFGIESVVLNANAAERLNKEKFEACVLGLGPGAEQLIEAARNSRSNSRCVIYGVGGNAKDSLRLAKYGINAMFHPPAGGSRIPPLHPGADRDRGQRRRRRPARCRLQH
jgi:hypothetical protein